MKSMKTLTINGNTYTIDDPDSASYKEPQKLTPEEKAQIQENTGAADRATTSQGRNAKYTFSTGGWKRILNIIRASNGEVDLGLVCNFPYRSTQILAFDMSGYVKYPKQTDGVQGDTTDSKPVLIKRYENSFGIRGTQNAPQAKITKVRIGYPAPGTSFPEKPEDDYEHNPVNCSVDIYVDIDESKIIEGRALPDFNMNYAGFANSHYCEAIEEETDATNTGIYGETLTFYEVNVANMNAYMTRSSINRDGIFPHYGLAFTGGGTGNDLRIVPATNEQIDEASNTCYNPITPGNLKYAVTKYVGKNNGTTVHLFDCLPGEIGPSEVDTKYKVGDVFILSYSEYGDSGIYELTGFDTESDPGLVFPTYEKRVSILSEDFKGLESLESLDNPSPTERLYFRGEWHSGLLGGYPMMVTYNGSLYVTAGQWREGSSPEEEPEGWIKLTGLTDADKKELVNDVIAALPVYDGSVV